MTTNYDDLREQAITKSRAANAYRDRWDMDDNRRNDEITIDATLHLITPVISKLEAEVAKANADAEKLKNLQAILAEVKEYIDEWPDEPYSRKRNILASILEKKY